MGWNRDDLPDRIRRQVEAKEGNERMEKLTAKNIVGIDPGTTTGFAVYSLKHGLVRLASGTLIEVYHKIVELDSLRLIRIEDARKRKWYGKDAKHKQQGAGSIKRDSSIWEEICEYHEWNYEMVHPQKGATKLDAKTFRQMTGWKGRTNEHKRDAGMLVYGY